MGKTILITGAANGIGKAAATLLADKGYTVYGGDIDLVGLEALAQTGVIPLEMDVTSRESVNVGVDLIVKDHGKLDVLVANAGYTCMGAVECVPIEEAQRNFDVNLFGAARCIQAAMPSMRASKSGRIILISSVVGHVPVPGMAWYPATKHAMEAVGAALRIEAKPFGIDVSIINPGFINTALLKASLPTLDIATGSDRNKAYAALHEKFRENFSKGFNDGAGAATVSKAILKAVTARRPKRRYRPNMDSVLGMIAARYLPESVRDRVISSQFIG